MEHVRHLAESRGTTVVSTIHSPSEQTMQMFDDLLLLVAGRRIYFGALFGPMDGAAGSAPGLSRAGETHAMPVVHLGNALKYFTGLGVEYDEDYSLIEWIMEITAPDTRAKITSDEVEDEKVGAAHPPKPKLDFVAAYAASPLRAEMDTALARLLPAPGVQPGAHYEPYETRTGFIQGVLTLAKYRSWRSLTDPQYLLARNIDKIIFSFIIFSLYLFVGSKTDPQNINNVSAVLFMCAMSPAFGAVTQLPAIVMGRTLFYRERNGQSARLEAPPAFVAPGGATALSFLWVFDLTQARRRSELLPPLSNADGCYYAITFCVWKLLEEAFIALFSAAIFTCTGELLLSPTTLFLFPLSQRALQSSSMGCL